MPKARRIDDYAGRKAYKVPVRLKLNDSRLCATLADFTVEIIARSPQEAAEHALATLGRPETEAIAYGPHGGKTYRFYSWSRAIAEMMAHGREVTRLGCRQLCLQLDTPVRDPFLAL